MGQSGKDWSTGRWQAVALAAIVAGAALVACRDTSRPAPADRVPPPPPVPTVAVWYDVAGLHFGDRVVQTPVELYEETATGEGGVLALVRTGALYSDRATDDVWFHPWDGQPRVVGHDSREGPGGDPHGDIAAWFEGGKDLVVYDTARGREVSRTAEAVVVDYSGREHVNSGNGFKHVSAKEVVWRSESGMHRLDLRTGKITVPHVSGALLLDVHDDTRVGGDFDTDAVIVDVTGREDIRVTDLELFGRLSGDGSFLLSPWQGDVESAHGAAIVDVRNGEEWVLPGGIFYAWISWSYGDLALVLVQRDEADEYLLACHALTRACTRLPHQGAVLLPTS